MASDIIVTVLSAKATLGQIQLVALWQPPAGMACLGYMQAAKIAFYRAATNNFTLAAKIGESTNAAYTDGSLAAGATFYYWARAVDADGNEGARYPTGGGIAATTLTSAPGPGSVGPTELADNAVTTTKIADAAITNAKIASLAADKLTAGTVTVTVTFSAPIINGGAINGTVVTGTTINGGAINGVTITGGMIQTAASGARVAIDGPSRFMATYDSAGNTKFAAGGNGSSAAECNNYANDWAFRATCNASGSDAHAIRGRNIGGSGGHGIVGLSLQGGGYGLYSQTGGIGPFTGAHDAFLAKDAECEIGDIVADVRIISRDGIDDTVSEVARTTIKGQKAALGVMALRIAFDPAGHISGLPTSDHDTAPTRVKRYLAERYDRLRVNSVGEGQINVCGRGGAFDAGDLIIASDLPGKGERQRRDVIRASTVAKIREAVNFDFPDQVKRVACIYLAG